MLNSTANVQGMTNIIFFSDTAPPPPRQVWIRQMVVSAALLPALICGTAFLINFVALYYHASRAIPFVTMVTVLTNYIPLLPREPRHPLRHHGNRTD